VAADDDDSAATGDDDDSAATGNDDRSAATVDDDDSSVVPQPPTADPSEPVIEGEVPPHERSEVPAAPLSEGR
jgi:hypothetical protein